MDIRFLVQARNDDMVALHDNSFFSDIRTKEHKNVSYEHPSLHHEQAPACHCLMFINKPSLYLQYKIHSCKNKKGKQECSSSVLTYKSKS